ncbi:MAG: peptidoglycan bridge formation glycyltransferase FemA/FemB family protein [Caldilineaceae bacterium]
MMTPLIDDCTWDAFVASHPAAHILQTSAWGALKGQFEWRPGRVALQATDKTIQAGSLLLYRRVWGLTLAYAPKGPLTNWQDRSQTNALLAEINAECKRHGAALLKIEPDLPDTPVNRALLASYGFRPSQQTVQPPSTLLLDINGAESAILDRMKSKWRYNIRLADRKGISVREAGRGDLPAFNALMATTGQRDGFAVHSADYYTRAFDLFTPKYAAFLFAEFEQQPLAALVVFALGKTAWYLWGASSDRERNRMPNHALQWAAMRWARARGATLYDFWGIPDEVGKVAVGLGHGDGRGIATDELPLDLEAFPTHDLWGVYRFKQGFGGNVVRYVGAWDKPVNEIGYRVYQIGLVVREKIVELRSAQTGDRRPETRDRSEAKGLQFPVSGLQPIQTPEEWRAVLTQLPAPHVLQSWEWGSIKGQTEWTAERIALSSGQETQAAFQFLWRQPAPHLPLRVGYIPKGPVLDWGKLDLVDQTLHQIEQYARAKQCLFVKIDPDVREDTTRGKLLLHALERRGWRFSQDQIQFKNTAFTALTVGEAALLEGMKSKWRYNVRLAERRGIRVRLGTLADLAAFYDLYAETGQRDGFLIRPFSYYKMTWETYLTAQTEPNNPAGGALLLAEHADDPLLVAGLFLMRYGQRSWYFYGASSERHRRDMPNYLLQWEAMRWSLAQGCTVYDWWGAPTEIDDPDDGMQGVWQFKQGFGAEFQPHVGAWDFVVSPLLYRLYTEAMPKVLAYLRRKR